MTTKAVAPRLPFLLDAMKEEIELALKKSVEPDELQKRSTQLLFTKLLGDAKESVERVLGVAQYYTEDNYPVRFPEHVAQMEVSINRLESFLRFRETLAKFEQEKAEAAKVLVPATPDWEVVDTSVEDTQVEDVQISDA